MRFPVRGLAFLAVSIVLSGCIAPMSAREARQIASTRLAKYCAARCGAFTWSHTQKIKQRWLVDFDGQRQKFTVTVEDDGNASVSVWDKGVPQP